MHISKATAVSSLEPSGINAACCDPSADGCHQRTRGANSIVVFSIASSPSWTNVDGSWPISIAPLQWRKSAASWRMLERGYRREKAALRLQAALSPLADLEMPCHP